MPKTQNKLATSGRTHGEGAWAHACALPPIRLDRPQYTLLTIPTEGEADREERRRARAGGLFQVPVAHELRGRSRHLQQLVVVVVDHGGAAAAVGLVGGEALRRGEGERRRLVLRAGRLLARDGATGLGVVLVAAHHADGPRRLEPVCPSRPQQLGGEACVGRARVAVGAARDERDHAHRVGRGGARHAHLVHDAHGVGVRRGRGGEVLCIVGVVQQRGEAHRERARRRQRRLGGQRLVGVSG
eukprot:scaffold37928_cov74-Phaeocystis_antarctica.AAC.1